MRGIFVKDVEMSAVVAAANPNVPTTTSVPKGPDNDPKVMADQILRETSGKPATYDKLGQIEARLDDIERNRPEYAVQVRAEIMASNQLTATEKGQLRANAPGTTINLDGNLTQRLSPNGMAWDPWINGQRAKNTPQYQALARLAGSTENAPIKAVMSELQARGITASQLEAEKAGAGGPSGVTLGLDLVQMALDLTGIVDPSPISDGSNAVISLGRGLSSLFSGEWKEAGGHLVNGAISVVGIVPALGDLAKAGKIGKWAQTVADAITMISKNPAMAKKLEPALREISDLVNKIPQGALDALPSGAREALTKMKGQLDEFFGAASKKIDEVKQAGVRLVNNTLVLDVNKGLNIPGLTGKKIGDVPSVTNGPNGSKIAKDIDGNDVKLRKPATYDSATPQPDGGMLYTKNGVSVKYDANGFPVFNAKGDVYLEPKHIKSKDDGEHFKAANEMMGNALRNDPSLAKKLGLTEAQANHLMKQPPSSRPPADLTWHHHQDSGRIQLVDRAEHAHFSGGHTGGMKLWGGGRD
jgi:hypothetical protein